MCVKNSLIVGPIALQTTRYTLTRGEGPWDKMLSDAACVWLCVCILLKECLFCEMISYAIVYIDTLY